MYIKKHLADLIAKAKRSMWGKTGLSSDLARNMYIAECLLANGVTVQEWIPVAKRLPEENQMVRVWIETPVGEQIAMLMEGGWVTAWENDTIRSPVTHWMPLDEPPEGQNYDLR